MKALVTGGAGFIGSHLADQLLAVGHAVVALDDLSTGSRSNVEHLLGRDDFELVVGTVLDDELVASLLESCDAVFHLAAAVGVRLIVEQPLESLLTNIGGAQVVLARAAERGVPTLVISSSEIYGKNGSGPLREDDDRILGSPLKSRWSYAGAKAVSEMLAHAYARQRNLPAVIVRLFNTVGPRQTGRYGMVLPRLVGQALAGEPLTVYGDGRQTRCFCHVRDTVGALVRLLETPRAYGQVVNVGGLEEISIHDLALRVLEVTGSSSEIHRIGYDEAYEVGFEDMPRRVPDIGRARELVGFEPTLGLDDIIRSVVEDLR